MKPLFQKTLLTLALGATLTAFAPATRAQHMQHRMPSKSGMAARYNNVRGQIVSISRGSGRPTITFAHESIPGFMRAMTMTMPLHSPRDAMRFKKGAKIRFDLLKMGGTYHVANIRSLPRSTRLKLAS